MKKRLGVIAAAAICVTMFMSACEGAGEVVGEVAANVSNTVAQMLNGTVKGEVGKIYGTQWFEFTVKSIEKTDTYAGYSPEDGFELYDVLVSEKGTFDDDNPMGTFDFYMDAESFEEYIFPIDPLDDTMMPTEFILKKDETVEYHMIFEIPAGTEGLMLCYTEIDANEEEGTEFTINVVK